MITLRRSLERGYADRGWLKSFHSFSFADYHDPAHMGFGPLRVINEDWIAPGMGFGTHPHRDMEIITYVMEGALQHKDSMGNGETIRPHDVQRMSAGRGILHSEFNHEPEALTHLLQIWIEPHVLGVAPSYEQVSVAPSEKTGRLCLIAGPREAGAKVSIHSSSKVYVGLLNAEHSVTQAIDPERLVYLHLAKGQLSVNGFRLQSGDAAKLVEEAQCTLTDAEDAEVLLFDLPH